MRKKVQIALVIFCFAFAALLLWQALQPREPTFQGKPLRYWLRGYAVANGSWNSVTPEMANEAVQHIGTNATPVLLEMIKATDSPLDVKLLKWSYTWRRWAGKQHLVKISPIPHLRSYESIEAGMAFEALGPAAVSAVPSLANLLDRGPQNGPYRGNIELVLARIGSPARQAVPALLRTLQNSNWNARGNALFALGCIHTDSDLVVPEAAKALGDPDPYVRRQAALALKAYGTEARSSVPSLLEALAKYRLNQWPLPPSSPTPAPSPVLGLNDPKVAAEEALKTIDPEAAFIAGVK